MTSGTTSAPNQGKPYTQNEIDLILSLVPNQTNLANLASALGRSTGAIGFIFHAAYGGKLLKHNLDASGAGDDVFDKIANAKKRFGILIGYEP